MLTPGIDAAERFCTINCLVTSTSQAFFGIVEDMPKMKTHKGTAKRVQLTGSGKLKRRRAMVSHNLEHKSVANKRAKHGVTDVADADVRRVKRLLGAR